MHAILAMIKKYPEYFLYVFAILTRYVVVFLLLNPEQYRKFMPYQNDIRGVQFALGNPITNPELWSYYYIPLGLLYKLVYLLGLDSSRLITVAFFNIFLGATTIVLFYKIARLFLTPKISLLLSILSAVFYPLIYFNALNISENLYLFILFAAIYILLRKNEISMHSAVSAGILLGIAYVLKPLLLFFFPLFIIWLFMQKSLPPHRLTVIVTLFISLISIILATGLINQNVSQHKQFVLSASGAPNFVMTQCKIKKLGYKLPGGERAWFTPPPYWKSEYPTVTTTEPFRNTSFYMQMGLRCIAENPQRFILNATNLTNIFFGTLYPDFPDSRLHKAAITISALANFLFFLLFLIYPIFEKNRQRRKRALLFYILILGIFFSIFLGNPGESRYGLIYFPIFLLVGTLSLQNIGNKFPKLQKRFSRYPVKIALPLLSIFLLCMLFAGYQMFFGRPTVPKQPYAFTPEDAQEMLNNTSTYLLRSETSNGTFIYELDSQTAKRRKGDNLTRQILSMQGIANAASLTNDSGLLALHKKNVGHIQSRTKKAEKGTYIADDSGSGVIHATAFAIMTYTDSPYTSTYTADLQELGEFILSMQKPSGEFYMRYPLLLNTALSKEEKYDLERFGSGEAALACIKLYQRLRDDRFLTCTQKAFTFYYPIIRSDYDPSFGSWHTIAYAQLAAVDSKHEYTDAIRFLSKQMMALQDRETTNPLQLGGFDRDHVWYTSAEAVFTESLGYAYRALKDSYPTDSEQAKRANELGLLHLFLLQNTDPDSGRLYGGIQSEEDTNVITIDNNGHTLMALQEFLTRN